MGPRGGNIFPLYCLLFSVYLLRLKSFSLSICASFTCLSVSHFHSFLLFLSLPLSDLRSVSHFPVSFRPHNSSSIRPFVFLYFLPIFVDVYLYLLFSYRLTRTPIMYMYTYYSVDTNFFDYLRVGFFLLQITSGCVYVLSVE